jgi:hypothetical protein
MAAGIPAFLFTGIATYLGNPEIIESIIHATFIFLFFGILLSLLGIGFIKYDHSIKWINVLQFFCIPIMGIIFGLGYIFLYQRIPLGGWRKLNQPPVTNFRFFPYNTPQISGNRLFIISESGLTYSYGCESFEECDWVQEEYHDSEEGLVGIPHATEETPYSLFPKGVVLERQISIAHVYDATLEVFFVRLADGSIYFRSAFTNAMMILFYLMVFPFAGLVSGISSSKTVFKLRHSPPKNERVSFLDGRSSNRL